MALADWSAFLTQLGRGDAMRVPLSKAPNGVTTGRISSPWVASPLAGTAPTTAAVPTRATTGSYPFNSWTDPASLSTYCIGGNIANEGGLVGGTIILVDRLSHQGGLSGTVTTAQTTNLPTSALTRHTSGAGVMLGLEIYTQIGTTATTVSASYTNQDGTSGQTTPLVAFGGTNLREAQRVIVLPLASGDTGVQAVASVTVTATTGTAGAFGVTLFKPITMLTIGPNGQDQFDPFIAGNMAGLVAIEDDACLQMLFISGGNVATASMISGDLILAQV